MPITPDQLTAIDRHLREENWLLNEDLITELTDHYINGVSERMGKSITFDAAIREIHQDFGGRKGLLKMEGEYQASQMSQVKRLVKETMRRYFQLPRLGITVLLLILVYGSLHLLPEEFSSEWIKNWQPFILLAVTFIFFTLAFLRIKNYYGQTPDAKATNQALAALFQSISTPFLLGYYGNLLFPVDKVLLHNPLPLSVIITLFMVFELAALETAFHFLRKTQSPKLT